jgi:hypothetical protein
MVRSLESDFQLGQRLVQLVRSAGADLGEAEVQPLEASQPLQVHQPRIGDLGTGEPQLLQASQPLQVDQTGIADPGVAEVQSGYRPDCCKNIL